MCVGIEVAKAPVDLARRPTAAGWRVAHDDPGITPLVARWRDRQPLLRVLEATGGHDVPVTAARTAAGWPVVVGTPRHARDVAHATGRLATTAAGEAHGLAHVAEAVRPAPRPLPEAQPQALSALLARRRPRLARRTAEQNRLGSAPRAMQADIQAHLTGRERRRAALNKDLGTAMRASPVWREPDDQLPSPPAWAQSSRRRWLPTARRGGPAAGSRSRPWWASPRATGIVAPCGANGPSGGAGLRGAPCGL
jgi:transposase